MRSRIGWRKWDQTERLLRGYEGKRRVNSWRRFPCKTHNTRFLSSVRSFRSANHYLDLPISCNGSIGHVIYLKASISGDEDAQYRSAHPSFPHETTANQFFSEDQFKSYRKLGQHIIRESFRGWGPGDHPAAEALIGLELIQLMENVFLDLRLDDFWSHPDNRGWAILFMRWVRSPRSRAIWNTTRRTFGIRFEYSCEARLGLQRDRPIVRV